MGQRQITLAFCVLALLVQPSPAEALDRVTGEGFGFVVPGGFQPAPRKMREAAEKQCVAVAAQIPVALKGRPTFRMYIVPGTAQLPEASIAAYAFTLPEGQRHPPPSAVKPQAFESGLLSGMSSLRDLRAGGTHPRNLGDQVVIVSTLSYDHAQGGNRTLRVALCARNHVACLMFMDSPAEREGTYRVHWDGIVGSLRLGTTGDQAGFVLRYLPIFGVALGILLVLIFGYVTHRRRRARGHLHTLEEAGFRGNTISDLKGSRAVDGLEIFDQEEPPPREATPPEPQDAPPLAAPPLAAPPRVEPAERPVRERGPEPAPESKDEDALDFDIPVRTFDKVNDVIAGAGLANAGGAPEERPTPKKVERKVLQSAPRKNKDGPAKIVRNDDYLR